MLPRFSPDQLPLLITGIAGVAGYNAFRYYRQHYGNQVIGLRPKNNWPLSGPGIIGCDFENPGEVQRVIEKYSIRSILNCGGSCRLKACELDPAMANRVNVQGIQNLLNAIDGTDTSLVHLSIDLVYSGSGQGFHLESDPTDPVTVYGKTMVAAENLVLGQRPSSCVLRISLPMGVSFNGHAGAIDWIQSRFAKEKPATLYFDEVRTPSYTDCLNEVIEEVFARKITGLFHAGGPKRWSLYQIAQIVNRVGGYAPKWLEGCPRIEAGPIPPRAGDVTMNSQKLKEILGREPFVEWPEDRRFWPDSQNWHVSRPDWQGSPSLLRKSLYERNSTRTK
jgi:dTDP-4-dehydrorhamnose reductase